MTSYSDNMLIRMFMDVKGLKPEDIPDLQNPKGSSLHDPSLLHRSEEWIAFLHEYRDKNVLIIPDYDPDGQMGGTVLKSALHVCGFKNVVCYFPSMATGFGLRVASLNQALELMPDADLIVTADNGIMAHEGIAEARRRGIAVLVSDHHPGTEVEPDANVIVNPNSVYDKTYPFKSICGAQVAYKLMCLYAKRYCTKAIQAKVNALYVFAGIGCVADMMAMLDENRYFVRRTIDALIALEKSNATYDPKDPYEQSFMGLKTLLLLLRINGKLNYGMDEGTIGFYIAPMLNSARRIELSSASAFALFCSSEPLDILNAAKHLYALNEERKNKSAIYKQEAYRAFTEATDGTYRMLVQKGPYGMGYPGLVSGFLTESTGLPSIVFSDDGHDYLHGSGRAPSWFDLAGNVGQIAKEHPDWFGKYGGHREAMGLTLKRDNFEDFQEAFDRCLYDHLLNIEADKTVKRFEGSSDELVDTFVWARPFDLTKEMVEEYVQFVDSLKPYGTKFPKEKVHIPVAKGTTIGAQTGAFKEGIHYKFDTEKLVGVCWKYEGRPSVALLKNKVDNCKRLGVSELPETVTLVGELGYSSYSKKPQIVMSDVLYN